MKLNRLLSLACVTFAVTFAGFSGAASAQTPDVLNVATDATFPPMEFTENGARAGFDVDMMNALAKAMGKRVQWTDIDFKGLVPGLIAHRFDAAISGIYITDERAKVIDFTDSNGKKVSVQVGTKSVNFLRDNFPQINRVEVEKNQEMFDLVGIGRADAAVTGKPAAYQFAKTRGGFHVLEKPLTTEAYGIAVRKDEPQLKAAFNAALAKIKADGTYAAIVKKWFGATAQ